MKVTIGVTRAIELARRQYTFEWDPEILPGAIEVTEDVLAWNQSRLEMIETFLKHEATRLGVTRETLMTGMSFEITGLGGRELENGQPVLNENAHIYEEFRTPRPQYLTLMEYLRAIQEGEYSEMIRDGLDAKSKSMPIYFEPQRVRVWIVSQRLRELPTHLATDMLDASFEIEETSVPAPEVPAPEMPAPEMPAPEMPAPEMPAPEAPAPEAPAPEVPITALTVEERAILAREAEEELAAFEAEEKMLRAKAEEFKRRSEAAKMGWAKRKQRSEAARKGWKTRKANIAKRKTKKQAKRKPTKQVKKQAKRKPSRPTKQAKRKPSRPTKQAKRKSTRRKP